MPQKLLTRVASFFGHGRGAAIELVWIALVLTAASTALLVNTLEVRLRRDVARLMLEDRLEVLDSARWRVAGSERMLRDVEGAPEPPHDRPYLVISLEERHLWYKQHGAVLFSAEVATGSGKTMIEEGGASVWKFETPRGRLVVQGKEEAPVWAPPDWHYVEQSRKRRLGLAHLENGRSLTLADGSVITVDGNDVVRVLPDGRRNVLQASDGRDEIVVDGKVLVPPLGTTQRRYEGRSWHAPPEHGKRIRDPRHEPATDCGPCGQPWLRAHAQRGHREALRDGARGHARIHLLRTGHSRS